MHLAGASADLGLVLIFVLMGFGLELIFVLMEFCLVLIFGLMEFGLVLIGVLLMRLAVSDKALCILYTPAGHDAADQPTAQDDPHTQQGLKG